VFFRFTAIKAPSTDWGSQDCIGHSIMPRFFSYFDLNVLTNSSSIIVLCPPTFGSGFRKAPSASMVTITTSITQKLANYERAATEG